MSETPHTDPSHSEVKISDLSDRDLVTLCQLQLPHDLEAYKEIVKRYEGMVYNICLKFLDSREDAEEVTQDSLLQVFYKIHQFQGKAAFKTWLYKIVHNYCRNRIDKIIRKRRGHEAYDKLAKENLPTNDFDKINNSDKYSRIQEVLNKLKPTEKEVLVYKFVSDMTLQEISEVVGISISATKMRYYRALDSFKKIYSPTEHLPSLESQPPEKDPQSS